MLYIAFSSRVLLLGSHTVYILSYNSLLVKITKFFLVSLCPYFCHFQLIGRQNVFVIHCLLPSTLCACVEHPSCSRSILWCCLCCLIFLQLPFFFKHPSLWIALFTPLTGFLSSRLKLEWFLLMLCSQPLRTQRYLTDLFSLSCYSGELWAPRAALKISLCRFGKPVLYQFVFENLLL